MTGDSAMRVMTPELSQSAFVRGFIDDGAGPRRGGSRPRLNPRSCAASSMTIYAADSEEAVLDVSIRVRARLHR